jgi:hypothetical protein
MLRKSLLAVAIASVLATVPFAANANPPGGKIEVCHNGKTLSIAAPALGGLLTAGATEGPCAAAAPVEEAPAEEAPAEEAPAEEAPAEEAPAEEAPAEEAPAEEAPAEEAPAEEAPVEEAPVRSL